MNVRHNTLGGVLATFIPSKKPRAESVPSDPSEPSTMIPLFSSITILCPNVP